MDRDVIYAVVVAVFGTALVGSYYFAEPPAPAAISAEVEPAQVQQRVYAPNDVRYRLQQQQLKELAKAKKRKVIQDAAAAPAAAEDGGSADEGSIDDSPVTDHAPVGEPDIE